MPSPCWHRGTDAPQNGTLLHDEDIIARSNALVDALDHATMEVG